MDRRRPCQPRFLPPVGWAGGTRLLGEGAAVKGPIKANTAVLVAWAPGEACAVSHPEGHGHFLGGLSLARASPALRYHLSSSQSSPLLISKRFLET